LEKSNNSDRDKMKINNQTEKINRRQRRERLKQQKSPKGNSEIKPTEKKPNSQRTSKQKPQPNSPAPAPSSRPSIRDLLNSSKNQDNTENGVSSQNRRVSNNGKVHALRPIITNYSPDDYPEEDYQSNNGNGYSSNLDNVIPISIVADKARNIENSSKKRQTTKINTDSKNKTKTAKFRPISPLLYGVRLLILGVGLAAMTGTILSAWDHSHKNNSNNPTVTVNNANKGKNNEENSSQQTPVKPAFTQSQEITDLKKPLDELVKKNPKLKASIFVVDLDTGAYFDYDGTVTFSAASTIKVPIFLAFFQDVDAGKIKLDQELTLEKDIIGGGSGEIQYQKLGTKFMALEVAKKMMTISDNTATNMLIKLLGGAEKLNVRFKSWGLSTTVINNYLPDLEGTNTTTSKELVTSMGLINNGEKLTTRSRDRMLDIMQKVVTNTLLNKGLEKDANISHKTGDIGSMVGDVGLIDTPQGKRYMVSVMVKRPHNDPKAQELIREISKVIYQHFKKEKPEVKTDNER
jgi:beta-lactamase class A